jgi:hypothetical protein
MSVIAVVTRKKFQWTNRFATIAIKPKFKYWKLNMEIKKKFDDFIDANEIEISYYKE